MSSPFTSSSARPFGQLMEAHCGYSLGAPRNPPFRFNVQRSTRILVITLTGRHASPRFPALFDGGRDDDNDSDQSGARPV